MILRLAFEILPFRESEPKTDLLFGMKTSAFRQLCDFVQFFIGIVVYSFLLIKTKENIIIDDFSFQSAVTLEVFIVFEFISSLFK